MEAMGPRKWDMAKTETVLKNAQEGKGRCRPLGTQNLVGRQSRLREQTAGRVGTTLPPGPSEDHELLRGRRESRAEGAGARRWVKGPELTSEPTDSPQSCPRSGAPAHTCPDPLSGH